MHILFNAWPDRRTSEALPWRQLGLVPMSLAERNPELKLPDHIVSRIAGWFVVTERRTGNQLRVPIPTHVDVVLRRSKWRFIAAGCSLVFVTYVCSLLLEGPGFSLVHIAGLSAMSLLPFVFNMFASGLASILAYVAAYFSFAVLSGLPRMGSVKLGIIFFSGGPSSTTPYSIVPASEIFGCVLLGLLPFVLYRALGQTLVTYLVVLQTDEGRYVIQLRYESLVRETLRFMGSESLEERPIPHKHLRESLSQ